MLLRGDTDSVFLTCSLDRKRQRKVKKWDVHHKKYVIEFETSNQALFYVFVMSQRAPEKPLVGEEGKFSKSLSSALYRGAMLL